MTSLKIYTEFDVTKEPKGGKFPEVTRGSVEFQGLTGKMVLPLTSMDIEDIQQLLLIKTKVLAGEV